MKKTYSKINKKPVADKVETVMLQTYSTINRKPVKEIKDSEGNVIIRLHGEMNVDIFARCLLGMKPDVKKL